MLQQLIVLVGLQASGKSTFYQRHFATTHLLVSKDLMGRRAGKELRQQRRIAAALAEGRSVVVDNTNASPEERAPLVALGRQAGARLIAYYFPPDLPGSLARNALRTGRQLVPHVGILAAAKRLAPPTLEEGFDEVFLVSIAPGGAADFVIETTGHP